MGALLLGLLIGLVGCREGEGPAAAPAAHTASAPAQASASARASTAALVGRIALPDDHGDTPASATPLTLDEAVAGRLESERDRDVFAVALHAGDRYELSVASAGATVLRLLAADGRELRAGDPREPLRFDAPADGTWYLVVEPVAGSLDYALLAARLQP